LVDVRIGVGLTADASDFDTELLMHINDAIGRLNQNGIGNFLVVDNEEQKWVDLQNPTQTDGNQYFKMIPSFIMLSTKLIFDPPPPSAVQQFSNRIEQSLWRLKIAYETPYTTTTTTFNEFDHYLLL
jgi:hypothetical protein